MLRWKTEEFNKKVDKFMDDCMKELMSADTIKTMDARTLNILQQCLELVEDAKGLTVAQAKKLDDIDSKLDKLLLKD